MNLKRRLSLISTIVFGVVFTLTSSVVYLIFKKSTERVIFNELENNLLITAYFFLEEDELPQAEHGEIRRQFRENTQGLEIRIYDEENSIKYGTTLKDGEITNAVLEKIRLEKIYNFTSNNHFYSALFYPDNQGDFVVILRESKEDYNAQSKRLLLILGIVLLVGLFLIYFTSILVSNYAFKPVSAVINDIKNVDLTAEFKPITISKTDKDLTNLVDTFNQLLQKVSETLVVQKNFINYVSHEFKTPLTAISGNLEVLSQKERSPQEYQAIATKVLKNVYDIERILDTLLVVSGIKQAEQKVSKTRVDELIWSVLERLKKNGLETQRISISLETDNYSILETNVDKNQLFIAVYNLVENALKYGREKAIQVLLTTQGEQLKLQIIDFGTGISPEELALITQPFYRGKNAENFTGTGLGLSLTQIICKQNNISLFVNSTLDLGTTFTLLFKQVE
ncbi:MAG: sensor histidine kinase [Luteibaculaceae bacterium]